MLETSGRKKLEPRPSRHHEEFWHKQRIGSRYQQRTLCLRIPASYWLKALQQRELSILNINLVICYPKMAFNDDIQFKLMVFV